MNKLLLTAVLLCSPYTNYGKSLQTQVIAAVIVLEAGGEREIGMQAVASVINNRAMKGKGRSPYLVVIKPKQFSCLNRVTVAKADSFERFVERAKYHPKYEYALTLAEKILNKTMFDVVDGSDHYYADYIQQPTWAREMEFKKKIGKHYFYKS